MRRVFFNYLNAETRTTYELLVVRPEKIARLDSGAVTIDLWSEGAPIIPITIELDRCRVIDAHPNMPSKFAHLIEQMLHDLTTESGPSSTWFYDQAHANDPSLRGRSGNSATGWDRSPSLEVG